MTHPIYPPATQETERQQPRAWILARKSNQDWYFDHGQGD